MAERICKSCGKEIGDSDRCPHCGESQEDVPAKDIPIDSDKEDAQSSSDENDASLDPHTDESDDTALISAEEETSNETATEEEHKENETASDAAEETDNEVANDKARAIESNKIDDDEAKEKSPESSAKHSILKTVLAVNLGVTAIILCLIAVAVSTAYHWEKVDDPGHAETFRTEQVWDGMYTVTMDDTSPCYVGQDWTACINLHINEYNSACADKPIATTASTSLCSRYKEMITEMESKDGYWDYVSSLGSWGHLTSHLHYTQEKVSNNDYVAPTTHDAVCYLGFIGECPEKNIEETGSS